VEASFLENRLALASSALVDAMMNKEKIVQADENILRKYVNQT
jgi:hypothetical protein